jgi:hypothetical protein
MNFWDNVMTKWNAFKVKAQPIAARAGKVLQIIGRGVRYVVKTLFAMKKVFIAIPVAVGAMVLAIHNQANLPDVVGLDLQNNGAFSIQIARELAVLGPVAVTALCLLLMFCSRRTLTPWLVSVFSLALPVIILITNTFPT